MSPLKSVRIIEDLAKMDYNGVDGRCCFCHRRTESAIETHAAGCLWRRAEEYVNYKKKYGTINER